MSNTTITSEQIRDGVVGRIDLNTTISGKAVAVKILEDGGAVTLSSTGADAGTGDVTVKHRTTSGYGHIPTSGASGNFLTWVSDGVASWSVLAAADLATAVTPGASGNVLTSNGSTWISATPTAASGQQSKFSVTQSTHGLSVGDIIKSTGANTYGKAQADSSANAEVVGIVTVVTDANNFTYVTHGVIETGVPAQAAGTVLFLSPSSAGALTITEPATEGQISKPLVVVLQNASKALFQNFRGFVIGGGSSSTGSTNPGGILYLYTNYGGF